MDCEGLVEEDLVTMHVVCKRKRMTKGTILLEGKVEFEGTVDQEFVMVLVISEQKSTDHKYCVAQLIFEEKAMQVALDL